jgi:L-malate glycosyltransferase
VKIALLGPIETNALGEATGLDLRGAPPGIAQTPLGPLAAGLLERGHAVHVITLDPTVEAPVTMNSGDLSVTWCPFRAPPRYRTRVRAFDLFAREIAHIAKAIVEASPDIVHAHWTYEFAEAALRTRLPTLVTMHDLGWEILFRFRDAYRAMRLLMKYRAMLRIRHLTVVAPFMAPKARQYGYWGPVEIVPNGIDIPDFDPAAPALRPLDAPRIVMVGNTDKLKNIAAGMAAFRIIRQRLPQARLHLFGPGLDGDYATGEVGVTGHGNVAHRKLMEFLADEATLLIHPSLTECCPVIIEEAKARGVPAVGGRFSGGVGYVIGPGQGGSLADIRRSADIARAALALLWPRELYVAHAKAARADAIVRFDIRHVTDQYLSIYERLVFAPASGP